MKYSLTWSSEFDDPMEYIRKCARGGMTRFEIRKKYGFTEARINKALEGMMTHEEQALHAKLTKIQLVKKELFDLTGGLNVDALLAQLKEMQQHPLIVRGEDGKLRGYNCPGCKAFEAELKALTEKSESK